MARVQGAVELVPTIPAGLGLLGTGSSSDPSSLGSPVVLLCKKLGTLMVKSDLSSCGAYQRGWSHPSPSRATAAEREGDEDHHHTGSPGEVRAARLALDVPSLVIQPGNRTNGSDTLQKQARRKLSGGAKGFNKALSEPAAVFQADSSTWV